MTIGQFLKELGNLKTYEEASAYLIKAVAQNNHAWSNIKYVTGYLGNDERNRILNLFKGKSQ